MSAVNLHIIINMAILPNIMAITEIIPTTITTTTIIWQYKTMDIIMVIHTIIIFPELETILARLIIIRIINNRKIVI